MADVPREPRRVPGVDRLLRRTHRDVQSSIRARCAAARASADCSHRHHGTPDCGVGRATDPGGLSVGDSTTVYDPRSGSCVRYCLSFADKAMGIEEVVTAPRSPWQSPYVERVIGSIRRECLDHVIVLNERHLRAILLSYIDYYQRSRTHLALGKDTPERRSVQPAGAGRDRGVSTGRRAASSVPAVGGLTGTGYRIIGLRR